MQLLNQESYITYVRILELAVNILLLHTSRVIFQTFFSAQVMSNFHFSTNKVCSTKESIKKNVTILVYLVPTAFGLVSETYAPLFEVGIFHILNIKY